MSDFEEMFGTVKIERMLSQYLSAYKID